MHFLFIRFALPQNHHRIHSLILFYYFYYLYCPIFSSFLPMQCFALILYDLHLCCFLTMIDCFIITIRVSLAMI
jgi:hypothetical protein